MPNSLLNFGWPQNDANKLLPRPQEFMYPKYSSLALCSRIWTCLKQQHFYVYLMSYTFFHECSLKTQLFLKFVLSLNTECSVFYKYNFLSMNLLKSF